MKHISKALRMARAKGITQFYLPSARRNVCPRMEGAILPLLHKHSPDGATPDRGSGHLIAAYHSLIYPERMTG